MLQNDVCHKYNIYLSESSLNINAFDVTQGIYLTYNQLHSLRTYSNSE